MENDTSRLITIPNILTLLRILLVPVFLITYYQQPDKRWLSMLIFAIASITDGLDGYLARRLKQISSFGKLCDPLADKLMVLSMLFCLSDSEMLVPLCVKALNKIIVYLLLAKEIFMVVGGGYMLKRGHVVQSNIFGKVATALFCVAIIMVFPWHGIEFIRVIGQWLVLIASCATFAALISYITSSVKLLKQD